MPDPPRPLPAVHRLLPRVYYGWIIAGAASGLSCVVVGIGFYGVAVFLNALCSERGWSTSSVSLATTLYFVTAGVSGTLVGRSVDRRGARGWIAAGSLVMATALLGIGRVTEPWQLYLAFPLLAMGFAMAGGIPASALITRWFVARRALAMSIAQTGVSVGGVVLVPLTTHWILEDGLDAATRILALLVIAVVLPLAAFVFRASPEEHGLVPDGAEPSSDARGARDSQVAWTAGQAWRSTSFWMLVAAFSGILFCQVATAMHQIKLLTGRLEPEDAAFAVSATALGSIVARLAVGSLADRMNMRVLGVVLMLVQAGALVSFALAESGVALFGASLLFGFTIGNLFMLQTLLVAELFGVAAFGSVLGSLQLVTQTASGLGPYALGLLFEAFGGYRPGLLLLALLAVCAAGLLSRVAPAHAPVAAS